jgi:methyl-accepting chemotaxis protein
LGLIVTLLSLTAIIIICVGITQMNRIQQNVSYITNVIGPQQTSAAKVQGLFMAAVRAQKNAVIDSTDEASLADAATARKMMDESNQELTNLQKLFKDDPNPTEDQQQAVKQLVANLGEFQKTNEKILVLACENTNVKANTLLYGDALKASQELTSLLAGVEDTGTAAALGKNIVNLHLEINRLLGRHINATDTQAMDNLEGDLKKANGQIAEGLTTLRNSAAGNAKLEATLPKINELQQAFGQCAEKIIAFSRENSNTRSAELTTKEGKTQVSNVLQVFDALNTSLNKQMGELRAESVQTYSSARNMMLLIGIVGLGVALTMAWIIIRGILNPIRATLTALLDISEGDGDLTKRVPVASGDELGELATYVNKFIAKIQGIISQVASVSHQVASAATEIAASSEQMASGMAMQAEKTTQISAAIEEMSATVHEVAAKTNEAVSEARGAGQQAHQGSQVVQQTVDGMNVIAQVVNESSQSVMMLGQKSNEIGAIIETINDIADQTNLLALNAAIEAARAGEHGRGFSVVADEVRKLAERTTQATKEVSQSITAIQQETHMVVERIGSGTRHVADGVDLAQQAGHALGSILHNTERVSSVIETIAAATEQQSSAAEQIARSIESITSVTRQSSDGAMQSSTVAGDLSNKSEELMRIVNQFKL